MLVCVCVSKAKGLIACAVLSTVTPTCTGHVLSVVMETLYAAAIDGVLVTNGFEGPLQFNYLCKGVMQPRLVNVISH